jgi:TetR/AcrR family tetracycline transcriptional repressor
MLLRKANVVDGAVKFLDAEGLDRLTMRKLGAALNVHGGALYRHFPNKEALLDAVADKLLEGVGDPLPDGPWTEQIHILADRLRSALLAHRDGSRVVAGTYVTGANTHTAADAAVRVLCDAGLAPAQAGWLAFTLFYYVLGHAIEEQAQARLPADDDWRSRSARIEADVSPQYMEALSSLTTTDPAQRFDYGLTAFIQGAATRVPPARPRRGAPRPAAR